MIFHSTYLLTLPISRLYTHTLEWPKPPFNEFNKHKWSTALLRKLSHVSAKLIMTNSNRQAAYEGANCTIKYLVTPV